MVALRVMQIISNLEIGGAQEVVRTLAKYLACEGHVPVVCTFKDGPLRHEIEQLGVTVEILPRRRHSVVALPLFLMDMLRLRREIARLMAKHETDIVQTHLLRSLDFVVLSLKIGATRPRLVFWTIHNYNFTLRRDQLPRFKWLLRPKRVAYRLLYRFCARWINGFIAVSDEVRPAILEQIGPVEDKIAVICNGVDVERYQEAGDSGQIRRQLGLSDEARLMAMVGTFKRQKGHAVLIEATAEIIDRFPDLHVLLIGDGELRAGLQEEVIALGLDKHVHFLGSRNDIPELLAASDYFVLPSLWEGLPMALLEAMASSLPVIATEVSGTRQVVIPGETGLLVPPGNASQLALAMAQLLDQSGLAEEMGAAGHRRVDAFFSARRQAQDHVALYAREWNRVK